MESNGRVVIRWPTRVGVPPAWTDSIDTEARRRFLAGMESVGAEVVEVAPPERWEELSSGSLNGARLAERSEIFLDALKRDVQLFGVALSSWINGLLLSGDEYLKAQRAKLLLLRLALDELFVECDVVVQTSTVPFDMIGLPLLALPVGVRDQGDYSLPQGIVLGGLPYGEERLLSIAAAWQATSDWHRRRPQDPSELDRVRALGLQPGSRGRMEPEAVADHSE
ncbi:MAG: hypothetical protein EXR92_02315 [Gemmatimonadetes bacterium]|nr:hypothetical protein [Gemmatimonadota bacterium]